MKGNDHNGLFEVFKPGVRDDLSFGAKLWYWFTNVYWYHFKTITLLALFGIVMLIVLIGDILNQPNDDTGIIIAGDNYVSYEQEQGLIEHIKTYVDDVNGDGEVSIAYQTLCTSAYDSDLSDEDRKSAEQYDEFVQASKQKLMVSFADDRFILYIMDKEYMDMYVADGAMEPLLSFGISSENGYYIPVEKSPIFEKLGIYDEAGKEWCVGIKVMADSRINNPKIQPKYEQAVNVLKVLAGLIN